MSPEGLPPTDRNPTAEYAAKSIRNSGGDHHASNGDRAPIRDESATAPCPQCQEPMNAIRGSKLAVCRNCGFKDSCCY